jgi:hypothetical protein
MKRRKAGSKRWTYMLPVNGVSVDISVHVHDSKMMTVMANLDHMTVRKEGGVGWQTDTTVYEFHFDEVVRVELAGPAEKPETILYRYADDLYPKAIPSPLAMLRRATKPWRS